MTAAHDGWLTMYVGPNTKRDGKPTGNRPGIHVCKFNTATGEIAYVDMVEVVNPNFLAIHPNGRFLYSVTEIGERIEGRPAGGIAAFQINAERGSLSPLNVQSSMGTGPCHLVVDATGKYLLASNYAGGSVVVLSINPDGTLGAATEHIQHEGSSINPQRQQEPHPHSINLDPSNRYALVPDLGTDKVMIYEFDAMEGTLKPNPAQAWARTRSGAGPRHLDFHPNRRFVYVANELDSTVVGFEFDESRGTMRDINTLSTLPEGYEETASEKSWVADVHVHPNGKTVYVSNRGYDSIAIFNIDQESGTLSAAGYMPTKGSYPRNFAIDPNGNFLIVGHQFSDEMYVFAIDSTTGALAETEHKIEIPAAICIKMLAL